MEIIRFKNNNNIFLAVLKKIGKNVIQLNFTDSIPDDYLNGFEQLGLYNGVVEGDYLEYTTLYRTYEDSPTMIELSCDGSVYIPPVIPDPTPPYEPSFEEVKAQKIAELSSICKANIECGVDIEIDGNIEHFSYGILSGDQSNIDDLFEMVKLTGLEQPYHCDGGNCKKYTPEQIVALYIAQKTNKASQTTYYNQLQQYIENTYKGELSSDITDVKAVMYGQELTGIYLEGYNDMMEQSQRIISAAISKVTMGL